MLVFAMVAHEYAHAAVALQQGDDTAYTLGRVTLNPLPHIDPVMSLLLPAVLWFASNGQYTFGGAKPVPVNSRKFRNFKRGDILVSAAGVTTNFFLAFVWAFVFILLGLVAQALPAAGTDAGNGAAHDGATGSTSICCSASSTSFRFHRWTDRTSCITPFRRGRGTGTAVCSASATCRCSSCCSCSGRRHGVTAHAGVRHDGGCSRAGSRRTRSHCPLGGSS